MARKLALGVECQGAFNYSVACVIVGQDVFVARGAPLNRTLENARGMQDGDVFRVRLFLDAKGAPDVVGDDVHLVVGDFQNMVAQHTNHVADALAGRDELIAIVLSIVAGDAGARLDWVGYDAGVEKFQPRDVGGAGKGLVEFGRIAALPDQRDIAGRLLPENWGVRLHCPFDLGDCRKRLYLDGDLREGILRLRGRAATTIAIGSPT